MKQATIKAVEMVRRIRDAHYEQLRGKTAEERHRLLAGSGEQPYKIDPL